MESRRKYQVIEHYLIEIDNVKSFGSNGTMTNTFSWDVYIAVNDQDEYKGRAVEIAKNISLPWTSLKEHLYLDEMINYIERTMKNL